MVVEVTQGLRGQPEVSHSGKYPHPRLQRRKGLDHCTEQESWPVHLQEQEPRGRHSQFWRHPGRGEKSWLLPTPHPVITCQHLPPGRPPLEVPVPAAHRVQSECSKAEWGHAGRQDQAQIAAVSVSMIHSELLKHRDLISLAFVTIAPSTK